MSHPTIEAARIAQGQDDAADEREFAMIIRRERVAGIMAPHRDGDRSRHARPAGMKVLVADGTTIVRARLVTLIRGMPGVSTVLEARDGVEVLDIVRRESPGAVLLDLALPGRSGLEILEAVGDSPDRPRMIILSGPVDERLRQRCLDAGADHFFSKGLEFLDAVAVVARIAASGGRPCKGDNGRPYPE